MTSVFKIGDTELTALVHENKTGRPTLINVHDDERVSAEAGKVNVEEQGGRLIQFSHRGHRLIEFSLNGETFLFDPNRMFSDIGIQRTLERHSRPTPAAQAAIKRFASDYWERFNLGAEPVIIALHNITEGKFSVQNFAAGGDLQADAAEVAVNPAQSRFDFYYVTEKKFYDFLKDRGFNVVLQDNARVQEDGSLSVFCARQNIAYINIETHVEKLAVQIEMVRSVREMLGY